MTTNVHIISYLSLLFLEWEMFQTNLVQKIKTCTLIINQQMHLHKISH